MKGSLKQIRAFGDHIAMIERLGTKVKFWAKARKLSCMVFLRLDPSVCRFVGQLIPLFFYLYFLSSKEGNGIDLYWLGHLNLLEKRLISGLLNAVVLSLNVVRMILDY